MKKLVSLSIVAVAAMAAMAQPPVKSGNIPTDSLGTNRSDTIVSTTDSSQFSNQAYTDTAHYKLNDKVNKKDYKRTTTSTVSKSTKKSNASNKKYK